MVDYPKDSKRQIAAKVSASQLESRSTIFSLVHSFGGRGSPRS
jgi:hypothetical protein